MNKSVLAAAAVWMSLGLVAAASAQAQDLGGLEGTVVTADDNKPVAGAWVVAVRQDGGSSGPRSYSAQATDTGDFKFAGLPAGAYSMCAQQPRAGVLDPCQWGGTGPKATVLAGQTVSNFQIALKRGETLHVRINDPAKQLAAGEGKAGGAHVLLGVWGPKGMFHALQKVSEDEQGRDHELTIPADTDLVFSASTGSFDLDDVTEGPARMEKAAGGLSLRFNQPARSGKKTISLRVNEGKP